MGGGRSGGWHRLFFAAGLALLCWIVTAVPALAVTFDVNVTLDVADPNLGDGLCDVDPGTAGSQCSLRAAVQQANLLPSTGDNPHLVNVPAGTFTLTIPGRDEVAGATGDLNVTSGGIRIVGQGATQTIVQAGTAVGGGVDRVLRVAPFATALVESLTIRHGTAVVAGLAEAGGGILNEGTVFLTGVEVRDNVATNGPTDFGGGGVANGIGAALVAVTSTIADNAVTHNGGGISNAGTIRLDTTTVGANRTDSAGGGLFHGSPQPVEIRSTTIAQNEAAAGAGGGIATVPGSSSIVIANTILDNDSTSDNCSDATALTSQGFNMVSDGSCPLSFGGSSTDVLEGDIDLSELGLHGGQTRNYVPEPGSDALDAGAGSGPCGGASATDQRNLPRPRNGKASGTVARCDIGAVEVPNLTVRSQFDALLPGGAPSAACRDATASCTLRQAVLDGNAYGHAAITLPRETFRLIRAGRDEDAGLTGDLDVTAPLTVVGAGAESTIIQAGSDATDGIDRVFHVRPGGELVMRDLTLRFGRTQGSGAAGAGGAILAEDEVQLIRAVVRDNRAATNGGAISSGPRLVVVETEIRDNTSVTAGAGIGASGTVVIQRSTIANNSSTNGAGGAISASPTDVNGRVVSISSSTISGNLAPTGAAVDAVLGSDRVLQLSHATIVDNNNTVAGGAALRVQGTGRFDAIATLFAANTAPACQISGDTSLSLANMSDESTCNVGQQTRLNVDPLLGPLRANGGPTRTHALMPGSPAVDPVFASVTLSCRSDQRATFQSLQVLTFDAPDDGDDVPGARCDIGAFEVQRIVVDSTVDSTDPAPGDGHCIGPVETTRCPLRAAIQEANGQGHALVALPAGTHQLIRAGAGEDAAATGDLDVTAGLTLLGAAANTTIVQAGPDRDRGIDRVLEVRPGAVVELRRVTVQHGRLPTGNGGGILNQGVLRLTDVEIANNSQQDDRAGGAGLATAVGSDTTLRRVTIAENTARLRGGGILADGTMTLENVTISDNKLAVRGGRGGGIFTEAFLDITNVTMLGNFNDDRDIRGSAILVNGGRTRYSNSVFSVNDIFPAACVRDGGELISLGFNVAIAAGLANECAGPGPGDRQVSTQPFGPLVLNSGQTRTRMPLASSAAVDGGNPATPLTGSNGRCAATDQRNLPRPQDGNRDGRGICDAGAFEVQPNEGGGGAGGAGAFSVQASAQQAQPGQPVVLSFTWTVPAPQVWRSLDRLDLRLLGANGQPAFILRWTEAGDRYILLDAAGRELAAGTPGSATVLTTPLVSLALRDVKTQGSGPTGQSVTLVLPLVFSQAAADQAFTVQVAGRADSGAEDPFATAATIQVGNPGGPAPPQPSNDDEKDEKPERPRKETEEERQQRERGNAAGQDEYRIEGNVAEVHLDEQPPYLVIGTRDGPVRLNLRGDAARTTVKVGDYVTAAGEKVDEQLYEVDDLDVQ